MFACYAGIGVGHDTMQLRRHTNGIVDNHLAAGVEEEDGEAMEESMEESLWRQNDGNLDDKGVEEVKGDEEDEDEDEDDEDGASSVNEGSVDSNFDVCF